MKFVCLSTFLLYLVTIQAKEDTCKLPKNIFNVKTTKTRQLTYGDYLENALKSGQWSEEDQPCLKRLYKIIQDARNNTLYAVWMLDAMQMIPNGQLYGASLQITNYDECLDRQWRTTHPVLNTQYCHAEVKLSESKEWKDYVPDPEGPTDLYLKTKTSEGMDLTIMDWGLCLPDVCTNTTAVKIIRALLQSSHLSSLADEATITILDCEIAGEKNKNYDGVTAVAFFMSALVIIAVGSTYYTMNYKLNPKSYVHEVIKSFCLKRNYEAVTNAHGDEIHILNIMRIVACVLIVIGHYISLIIPRMNISGLYIDRLYHTHGTMQRQGNIVVDIFFTLSGMLIVRGYLRGNWSNPLTFLIKRYIRIFGLLLLLLYVRAHVLYNLGDGPLWEQLMGIEQKICQEHAWNTITTHVNYVSLDKSCYLISWSSAVDYHMSVVAVIICVLYGRSKRLGIFTFILIFVLSVVVPGYMMYIHKLPSTIEYNLESGRDIRKNIVFQTIYRYTHTRASPFLVGMVMGYILAIYKPNEYRKRISRKASYIYLIASFAVQHIIVELGGDYFHYNPDADGIAVFTGVHRALFAIGICFMIAVTEYGDLGILNDFIKISPLVTLGRLTYGVYVIHYTLLERRVSIARTAYTTDVYNYIEESLGASVVCFALSFAMSLLVEGPLNNIVSLLLDGPRGLKSKGKTDLDTREGDSLNTNPRFEKDLKNDLRKND